MTPEPPRALPNDPPETVIEVGDVVFAEGCGDREVIGLSVCLRPYADPGAETYSVEVDAVEAGVTFVADLAGNTWTYGIKIKSIVKKGAS